MYNRYARPECGLRLEADPSRPEECPALDMDERFRNKRADLWIRGRGGQAAVKLTPSDVLALRDACNHLLRPLIERN